MVVDMKTTSTSEPVRRIVDEYTRALGAEFDRLIHKRGLSQRVVANKAGVDPSHLGLFLKGEKRLNNPGLGNLARVLEAVVAVNDLQDVGDVIGVVGDSGEVTYQGESVRFPGLLEVPSGALFADIRPGDRVFVVAHETFELGKFLVVEVDGRDVLCQGVERGGVRGLLTSSGSTIFFEPDQHLIRGVATEVHPAPRLL